jgi:outer membrane protein assembly factor BamA
LGLLTGVSLFLSVSQISALGTTNSGQSIEEGLERRRSTLEALRIEKTKNLVEYEPSVLERAFLFVEQKRVMEYLRAGYHGFYPKFGGLTTGSGFALGPLYYNRFFGNRSTFVASAAWSFKKYQQYEISLRTRSSRSSPVTFVLHSRYRNFPEEDFFGVGAGSSVGDETDYRFEESLVRFGVDIHHNLGLRGSVYSGYRRSRADGSSMREGTPEEELFWGGVPGISRGVDYWLTEFEFGLDRLDSRGNPRSGVSILFDHSLFVDREDRLSFQRTGVEFQGYLPFFHKHRVLALRMSGVTTDDAGSQGVPFYDLPFVGGHSSLRGYEEYRFRDRKAVLINLEYRFEAFIGLDIALFGDTGQVGREWSDFRLSEFKSSYGGGFRFNTARSVFLRIDIGHSVEGTRFFFKFGNVF